MAIQIQGNTVIDNDRKLVGARVNNQVISTDTNAVAGAYYVATASLTLTLPASPTAGDVIGFSNQSNTYTCVIGANGKNIMSSAQDLKVNISPTSFQLQYVDATRGWIFI